MRDERSRRCNRALPNPGVTAGIAERLGEAYGVTAEYLSDTIRRKPTDPQQFGYFMDHAYFSAARLYRELEADRGAAGLTKAHLDVLMAARQAAVDAGTYRTILFGDRFPFRYLVDDYGLSYYAAFVGCSAEIEASFETIAFLAQKVHLPLPDTGRAERGNAGRPRDCNDTRTFE